MSKCTIAKLVREEIYNLTLLVTQLEDRSKLCYPNEYNCTECFNQVIRNLKKIKRQMKEVYYENKASRCFFEEKVRYT